MGFSNFSYQRPLSAVALVLAFFLFTSQPAGVRADPPSQPVDLLLAGGRVLSPGGIVRVDVLVRAGKIIEMGEKLAAPEGLRKVDASGMIITPGLIDAQSKLWLTTSAAKESASDGGLNVLDGVDLFSTDWREAARQGVTAVYVQPASTGSLGGVGTVFRCAPASTFEELVLAPRAGVQASLGVGGRSDTPRDRFSQYQRLKKALESVKKYDEDWRKYQQSQKKKESEKKKQPEMKETEKEKGDSTKKDTAPKKPAWDAAKESLRGLFQKQLPLRIEAHRPDDVAYALKIGEELDLKIVLEGVSNPSSTACEKIAKRRIPLVLGPFLEWGQPPKHRQSRSKDWPAPLLAKNPHWAIGTFGEQGRATRLLRAQAALAVAAGADRLNVLRSLTSGAAEILGVADKLGTIEVGRSADLAVFAGDPLDLATAVRLVISQGTIVFENPSVKADADLVNPLDSEMRRAQKRLLPGGLPGVYAVASTQIMRPGGKVSPGRLVVQNGVITSVDPAGDLPEDIPLYDLGDAWLTPGLTSAHADLGTALLMNETADADAAHLRAADVFDAHSQAAGQAARQGLLIAAAAPGSANVVSGSAAVVRLGGGKPIVTADASLKTVLSNASRNNDRFPASLAGQTQLARQLLSGKPSTTTLYLPGRVERELLDARKREIQAVLDKSRPALLEANTETEVRAALQIVEEFGLKGVLLHPEKIEPFLADIQRLKAAIVFRPIRAGESSKYAEQIAAAGKAGIAIAFSGDSANKIRLTAALAAQAGLPMTRALSALTGGGADIAGAPPNTGVLDKGSPADFVVWSGSPLDLSSRAMHVVVDGKLLRD